MTTIKSSTTTTTAYQVVADTTGALVIQTGVTPTTALTVGSDQSVTFAQAANLPNTFGFKNRIINGAMVIDQRNAGASVTNVSGVVYTVDRFYALGSQASKFTVQQNAGSVTPPTGFINYAGVTSSSAYALLAGDYFTIGQAIEGLNVADLAWGTASAATITLSFWVRSSLTGTFGGNLRNNAGDRNYPFTYTISTANTWEYKTETVAGDTSGTWLKTNAIGINVGFGLGVGATFSGTAGAWTSSNVLGATGATSVVGTNGATFYITGVQLEKGSTATSFDYRPYGTELALCQRYFSTSFQNGGTPASPDNLSVSQTGAQFTNCNSVNATSVNFSVQMRSAPTVFIYAPLVSPAVGKVRKSVDGFIFTNGTASFIGEKSFFPNGGDVNNPFQYGWVASAEL